MMDTKEIQKLIDFISRTDLDEVNIETSELKLKIKRSSSAQQMAFQPQAVQVQQPVASQPVAPSPVVEVPKVETPVASNLITIKSPMIGTFYRSAGPDKPVFVDIDSEISSGKVVCIIEAMKLFNEIESEISGKIVKILVEDATPVEFDQPLFLVEPN
jgi:acetyl-CoA carboxylase biotin carboxyl carrier protein